MTLLNHFRLALSIPIRAAAPKTSVAESMAGHGLGQAAVPATHAEPQGNEPASARHAPTEDLCGLNVLSTSLDVLAGRIGLQLAPGTKPAYLACLNPHSHFLSLVHPSFRQALLRADWLVPDGAGTVVASCLIGGAIRSRITGADVFHRVSEMLDAQGGGRVFFLGSTEGTLQRIRDRMRIDYPRIVVAGTYSPPFKEQFSDEDSTAMVEAINLAQPDVLWIGMTAPKQEVWIEQNLHRVDVRFAGAIGAVFDFYSGNIARAPLLLRRLGLEWLLRLVQRPGRMWRRTFISAPLFLMHVLAHKLRRRSRAANGD